VTRSSGATPDPGADPGPAAGSPIDVRFVGHATTLLTVGGFRVLTDPFLWARLGPLERHGPLPDPDSLEADVVVISHGHPDHFDRRSLAALPGAPVLVVPRGLGVWARRARPDAMVVEVEAGKAIEIDGLGITAVPARHWISPGAPRARPVGYLLDAGSRVYFAGDTGPFPAMHALARGVDLALLPVWTWGPHLGPGHLGPRTAAEVTADLAPRTVVPIHWGTLYPRHLHRVWRRPLVEPGERFEARARDVAPESAVVVLRPGEAARVSP
jgi:L-ascorbate metabolism protein UlaG (beta-lactamase superfamily)